MLCSFCRIIDLDKLYRPLPELWSQSDTGYEQIPTDESQYHHHASYKDLIISAQQGCELCSLVWMKDVLRKRKLSSETRMHDQWQEMRQGATLKTDENGKIWVNMSVQGVTDPLVYEIDRREDSSIMCSVWFDHTRWNGWESAGGSDIGPQQLKFQQKSPEDDHNRVELYSRCDIAIAEDDQDDSIIRDLIRHRPVNLYPLSLECLRMINEWAQQCLEHENCGGISDHPLPTRVIDVGPRDGSQPPNLVTTHGKEGCWISLSHCWGSFMPLRTTSFTLEAHQQRIQNLPPTFQDAISIVRALNVRYIWIDSLCILQDSEQDWIAESARMGTYYEQSILTLQLDAIDSSQSLLVPRKTNDVWLAIPAVMCSQDWKGTLHIGDEATDVTKSFINSRAWTFQEYLLAPRTLVLNSFGFIWSCRGLFAVERLPDPDENLVFDGPQWRTKMDFWCDDAKEVTEQIPQYYYLLVCEYMCRSITFETDRLVAWSAVAREVQRRINWTYVAGLWEQDMHRGLLWSYEGYGRGFTNYVAPTWSWASQVFEDSQDPAVVEVSLDDLPKVYGGVYRYVFSEKDKAFDCSIIKVVIDSVNGDPFGQLRSAQLTIRGRWREANILCAQQMPHYIYGHEPRYFDTDDDGRQTFPVPNVQIICDFDTIKWKEDEDYGPWDENTFEFPSIQPSDEEKRRARDWSRLSFLQITRWKSGGNPNGTIWALILEAQEGDEEVFERVGVAQIAGEVAIGWGMREVVIV